MWPFTSRRIMGNRWWAMAFVVYVCWQTLDLIGTTPASANNAETVTDITGAPVDDAQMNQMTDTLKSLQNAG